MIDEDASFESQEEIQKKYDKLDKKEGGSLNNEWFDKFEDLDESVGVGDEEYPDKDDSNEDDENWNNLFYEKQGFQGGGDMFQILERIKEENAKLKKREQIIKDEFERMKIDYSRISKEMRLIDNKTNRIKLYFKLNYTNINN